MESPLALSIILPAYREAENLRVLLPKIEATLRTLGVPAEILVVDTMEPLDDAAAVCAEFGVRYLNRQGGNLYGHAIRTGIAASRGERVVLMDADGSHEPAFIAQLWERRTDADLVIASRYMKGGKTENPAILILMSLMVNVVFRVALGLRCADVSNSFRLYTGKHLRGLTLRCHNFDIVEEILVKLTYGHRPYRILEIPCTFHQRMKGETKRNLVTFAFGYLFTLARLIRLKAQAARVAR